MLTKQKREININAMIVRDFNTPLSTMGRSSRQRINKETADLNNTIDQFYLTDIYRTFHPTTVEYTDLSSTHGTFARSYVIPQNKS